MLPVTVKNLAGAHKRDAKPYLVLGRSIRITQLETISAEVTTRQSPARVTKTTNSKEIKRKKNPLGTLNFRKSDYINIRELIKKQLKMTF